jgi:para-aminobenzoate synthetase/4-amino-4-deoxychorismate lyase
MGSARAGDRVCRPLDWEITSADALALLRDDAHPAALLGGWAGGSDIICAEPVAVRSSPGMPWDVLDEAWPAGTPAGTEAGTPARPRRPAFGGGWIGYLGFGLTEHVLPVPPPPGGPRRLPDWWFGYYDHVLRRDRGSGRWFFEALWTPERSADLDLRLQELCRRARTADLRMRDYGCGDFRLVPTAAEHKAAVGRAVEYIRRGDLFQANICLRLEAGFDGEPLDAFGQAVRRLDPPYAAFLQMAEGAKGSGGAVASLSPELFLRREANAVLSRPIKGTHVRSADEREAARQRDELERSAKNRAENVMIVDLMRNDLSRVCGPGTVQVPRLVSAEPHPGVWHLVSDVRGMLNPGVGDGELVRATFPPGSVTGAPKVRALEVIGELEATPRETYTGAVGYRSPIAGLELNVAIRTFEFHAGRVWLGSGGGIVAASRPADEYRECLLKASPLIAALGGRIATGQKAARLRPSCETSVRPRPAAGIFTSLLVSDGTTQRLEDHIARLDGSARRLFGKHLPPSLQAELADCIGRRPSGRLRITVRPFGGPLRATVEVVPLAERPPVAELHPVVIPGGLGAHKWLDRRLLAQHARATTGPGVQLLIEDADGAVLETDKANVFAVIGGVLRTPPADGRLLPGVTRAAVLRLAAAEGIGVKETPLARADLATATEVFVTNAVQGIVGVRSVAGTVLASTVFAAPGPLTTRLTAALNAGSASRAVSPVPGRAGGGTVRADRVRGASSVVVIDNYDSFTHNLVHLLACAGCQVEVVRNDEVTAEQVMASGPAGVLISPGPCAPADAGISMDVVRRCGADAVPLLGVCLGHQAIAAAFGARIVRAPRPVHGQTSVITHDGRGVLAGVPRRFTATRYHSLLVDERSLPPVLAVTARTRGGLPMGLRHAVLPIEGVQFHPESILTTHGEQIIRNFARAVARRLTSGFARAIRGGPVPRERYLRVPWCASVPWYAQPLNSRGRFRFRGEFGAR